MENTGGMMSREKLLAQGASSLTDVELLALFLCTGLQGRNVLTLAKEMLQHFESLYGLLSADYMGFGHVQGIGIAEHTQLKGVAELAGRYYNVRVIEGRALLSPEMACELLQSQLLQEGRKIFLVVFMDSQHRVIKHSKPSSGTLSHIGVHPRGIVREAIKVNTFAMILVHNHPSGCAEPDKADKPVTERVVKCCQLMGIRVLDHLVVGHGKYVSFAERGWIQRTLCDPSGPSSVRDLSTLLAQHILCHPWKPRVWHLGLAIESSQIRKVVLVASNDEATLRD